MRDGPISASLDTPPPASDDAAGAWLTELDTQSDATFFQAWLASQCAAVVGTRAGIILQVRGEGLRPVAAWPASRQPPVELSRIAERAANATRPVIAWARRSDGKTGLDLLIGLGLRMHGALAAVIAIKVDVPGGIDSIDPDTVSGQLQMGSGWLDARLSRRDAKAATARTERAAAPHPARAAVMNAAALSSSRTRLLARISASSSRPHLPAW